MRREAEHHRELSLSPNFGTSRGKRGFTFSYSFFTTKLAFSLLRVRPVSTLAQPLWCHTSYFDETSAKT